MVCCGKYSFRVKVISLGAMIQQGGLSHAERIQLHQTHCKGKKKHHLKGVFHT